MQTFSFLFLALTSAVFAQKEVLEVGTGIYDMTGPVTEVNFMGYALPSQRGEGLLQRLRARAFVFYDGSKRFAFVSIDGGMGSDLLNTYVIKNVATQLGDDSLYTIDNVAISGTHSHSGPAGFLQYVLFQVTSLGFVQDTFDAFVNACSNAIVSAHKSMQPASVFFNQGKLYDSNINRSPSSYLLNPQEERDQYPDGDTDKNMFLLKFVAQDVNQTELGLLNWFSVHGTAVNNTNKLVNGDNKGYASYLYEEMMNGGTKTGKGPFVAAFASTNLGDVSPNTQGAMCQRGPEAGQPCDFYHSTCDGRTEDCWAFGPGKDMYESCQIIGQNQFDFAQQLYSSATTNISGPIDYRHSFIDMSDITVTRSDGTNVTTCSAAMGYSFAAGTTDGPGALNFFQGETNGTIVWTIVRDVLSRPTPEEIKCQRPKPILLNTGDLDVPYQWDPEVIPIQILRLGKVFILSAPAEFTTMSGRRLRGQVGDILQSLYPGEDIYVTIAGLTNTYASYVATYEEYQAQRYEAASTLYGPHTLEAYIQEFSRLAVDMVKGQPSTTGPSPPDLTDQQLELLPPTPGDLLAEDDPSSFFGQCTTPPQASYIQGDMVSVEFLGANPRNDARIEDTYLSVQLKQGDGSWLQVADDGDWETRFYWRSTELPETTAKPCTSYNKVEWYIPADATAGTYQICYFGDAKDADTGDLTPISGCSPQFAVTSA